MSRVRRLGLGVAVAALSVVLVLALSFAGSSAEGPVRDALRWIGGSVARVERGAVRWLQGGDRAARLPWTRRYLEDPAALRTPSELLLGVYDEGLPRSLEGALELEEQLGRPFSLIQMYTAWGDRPDQQFPLRVLESIVDLGSVPVVTWEPWLTDFENSLHPGIELRDERDDHGLADVAAGVYDFYVDAWAAQAARFGGPILLRFAHEMNDPYRYPWGPQNNTPEAFVAAWRHVVERFRAAGAHNVLWVWSPHVAYEGFEWFYPGDDVVDWVATGALNYGTAANWARWWSFKATFGDHYPELAALGKPVMIAEFGSLAVGGDRTAWYRDALAALPGDYRAVRALLFFNVSSDATITYQALDWSVSGDTALVRAIREELAAWPESSWRGSVPASEPGGDEPGGDEPGGDEPSPGAPQS